MYGEGTGGNKKWRQDEDKIRQKAKSEEGNIQSKGTLSVIKLVTGIME